MVGLSRRRLHRAPRNISLPGGGMLPFRLTLTTSTPTINEGASAVWSIALDTRGYTRQSGDPPIIFYILIPSDTTAQGSQWDLTQTALFATANAVTGVTQTVDASGLFRFSLAYNFVGPITLTRPSRDDEVAEETKFTALVLYNASVGSPHNVEIVEPSRVEVILTDVGGPAPPPTLSLATSSLMEGSANGTAVGLLTSSAGGTPQFTLTHVDGVAIDGTDRFKITGLNNLQAGTVVTDYETAVNHTVTITSGDGGGPTVFNITVLNNTSDDPVVDYKSTPAPDGWYVTVGAPAGFVIATPTVPGTITGRAITDVANYRYATYLNAFGAGNHYTDLFNLFKISGANLIVGPVYTQTIPAGNSLGRLSFTEGTYYPGFDYTTGCGWYKVTIRYTFSGGGTQDVVYRIRPEYTPITPVNSSAFTLQTIAAVGDVAAAITNVAPNRHVKVPASVIGVSAANNNVVISGNHILFEGHYRYICMKRGKLVITGNSIHLKDLTIRVGLDTPGTPFTARDPIEINGVGTHEVYLENCDIGWGCDDIGIGNASDPRQINRIHFYRCLLAEPCWAPVHTNDAPSELSHPYGPRCNNYLTQLEFLKCMIIGHKNRSPQVGANWGTLLQNNIISAHPEYRKCATSYAGPPPSGHTTVSQGNLYVTYPSRTYQGKPLQLNTGTGAEEIYAVNKVITSNAGVLSATADIPLLNTDGGAGDWEESVPTKHTVLNNFYGPATPTVFRAFAPFKPPSTGRYVLMPIVTAANRNALIADVLDYVGCRRRDGSGNLLPGDANAAEITRRIVSNFRAGTNSGIYMNGISLVNYPVDSCAAGAPGDACRAVGGYVTGA